jgi:hypothetical protein
MANLSELRNILFKNSKHFYGVNRFWKDHLKKDPFLRNIFITVDLVFGNGSRYSYATDLVTVIDSNGKIIVYEPYLQEEPTISTQYSLGEGQAGLRTFTITIGGKDIDPISVIKGGSFLSGIAEVSLQIQNGQYDNRIVLMRGEMYSGINFGVKDEMIELQISDIDLSKDKIIPEYIITKDDFFALPDEFEGNRFPFIFNRSRCLVPCIRTDNFDYGSNFIVCFGHGFNVSEVFLNGISISSGDLQRGWTISEKVTNSGIPYTELDFAFPTDSIENGVEIEGQAWTGSESVYARVEFSETKSIIAFCQNLLTNHTTYGADLIDQDLFARSEAKTPYLEGDFVINGSSTQEATKAIEYIQSTVFTSFPMMSLVYTSNGIGLVTTDRRSQTVVGSYIVGNSEILDRSTGIQEMGRESLYNSFTLRYGYNGMNDNYSKTIVRNAQNSILCKISENAIGKRDYDIIDSIIIQDDSTAEYVLEWLASHLSLPSYYIEYECLSSIMLNVKVGDNITITDDELTFVNEKATIEKVEYQKGKVTIGVRYWILYSQTLKSS